MRWQTAWMDEKEMEGWYTDPYRRHEARWMSQSHPTRLVRDGNFEGSDPMADEPFEVRPTRIEGHPVTDGSDLLRADKEEMESSYSAKADDLAAFGLFQPKNMGVGSGNPIGHWVRSRRRPRRRPK